MSEIKGAVENLKRLKEEFDLDSSAFADSMKRIERDLKMTLGSAKDHWNKDDDTNRGASRPKVAVPLLGRHVNKALNKYNESPFGIDIKSDSQDPVDVAKAKLLKALVRGVEGKSKADKVYSSALKYALACGYGYFYTTTKQAKGKTVVSIERIDDPRAVIFSRSSRLPSGSDANIAYYVTESTLSDAKAKYGSDIVDYHGDAWLPNASRLKGGEACQIVTVWEMVTEKEKKVCRIYTIVVNKIVSQVDVDLPQIPIFRVGGYDAIIDKKPQFLGVTHNGIGAQRMVNYSASMVLERLALSPRPSYKGAIESIADNPQDWTDTNKSNKSFRGFRAYDDQGRALPAPERENDNVNVQDVTNVMQTFTTFIDSVIGFEDEAPLQNETAQSVLMREKNNSQLAGEIYSHVSEAIQDCGNVVVALLQSIVVDTIALPADNGQGMSIIEVTPEDIFGEFEVVVESGPFEASEKKAKLSKALAMVSTLGADAKLAWGAIADNTDDLPEDIAEFMRVASRKYAESMVGEPVQDPAILAQQMQAQAEQMASMQKQLDQANLYIQQQDAKIFALEEDSQTQLLMKRIDSDTKVFIERMKQAGSDQRLLAELEAERTKNMMDYTKELRKIEATQPKIELIQGARPDYSSVGGMRNNFN